MLRGEDLRIGRARPVALTGAAHGDDDVAAAARQADQRRVMARALDALVVEGFQCRCAQRRECGEEHGVFQPVVPGSAFHFAAEGLPGLTGFGEASAVADLGQDARPGARIDPGQPRDQLTKRVGESGVLDLRCEVVPPATEAVELAGELGDDSSDRRLHRRAHALGVERGDDGASHLLREARRPMGNDAFDSAVPCRRQRGGRRMLGEQVTETGLGEASTERALGGRRDAGEDVAEPAGEAGLISRQADIEAVQDPQALEQLVGTDIEPVHLPAARAGGVSDYESVSSVRLCFAGIEVRGTTHTEDGHIGDRDVALACHGERQLGDRAGLVDQNCGDRDTVLGAPATLRDRPRCPRRHPPYESASEPHVPIRGRCTDVSGGNTPQPSLLKGAMSGLPGPATGPTVKGKGGINYSLA